MSRGIADTRFTVGEIVASGWDLYCLHLKRILLIFLVVYVPINIGLSFDPGRRLGRNVWRTRAQDAYGDHPTDGILRRYSGDHGPGQADRGVSLRTHHHVAPGPAPRGLALADAILTGLLAMLIVFGLTLLLIVPGVIWVIYYSFFLFVVALRGLSGKPALDYSKAIVKGQWWRVFGYMLVIQLLALLRRNCRDGSLRGPAQALASRHPLQHAGGPRRAAFPDDGDRVLPEQRLSADVEGARESTGRGLRRYPARAGKLRSAQGLATVCNSVSVLRISDFEFVSDFGFRHSDFRVSRTYGASSLTRRSVS